LNLVAKTLVWTLPGTEPLSSGTQPVVLVNLSSRSIHYKLFIPSSSREKRNAYRLLVGTPEGKRPLGRPRLKWVDNIRIDLVELGWGDVDWIGLVQDRNRWRALVNSVLNLRVP
jgi:hypothetical protein